MAQFNSAERIDGADEHNGQTERIQVNDMMIEPTDDRRRNPESFSVLPAQA